MDRGEVIGALAALATWYGTGQPIAWLLFRRQPLHPLHKLTLALCLGTGTFALLAFWWVATGGLFCLWPLLLLVSPLLVISVILQGAAAVHGLRGRRLQGLRGISGRYRMDPVSVLLAVVIASAVAVAAIAALLRPVYTWDSVMNWTPKASMLYSWKTIESPFWQDPGVVHPHRDYPLLLPILEAWLFVLFGAADDQAVKVLFPLLFALLLSLFYFEQRQAVQRRQALLFTTMLATLPVMLGYRADPAVRMAGLPEAVTTQAASASTAYADLPLTLYLTACMLLLWRGLIQESRGCMAAGGLFCAFAVFTKNEGLIYAGLLCLTMAAGLVTEGATGRRRHYFEAVLAVMGACALSAPWYYFRASLPVDLVEPGYSVVFGIHNLGMAPQIAFRIAEELANIGNWGCAWCILAWAAYREWTSVKEGPAQVLLLFCVLCLGAYLAIHLCYTGNAKMLANAALYRLFMHPIGVVCFAVSMLTRWSGDVVPRS